MYAPVDLCTVGKPEVFGSKGHSIIQCGPILIGGSVLSNGSESLRWVAPASIYSIPGTFVVGRGLPSSRSRFHCTATLSSHIGGMPTPSGLPGTQVQSLVPLRSTVMAPCGPISATVASLVMLAGPADRARAILASTVSVGKVLGDEAKVGSCTAAKASAPRADVRL